MFGTSGIRGRIGEAVTADVALSVGRAVAADGAARVVVGRDPRESGEMLRDALVAGLRESGADVVDLGLAATPTVARHVGWQDADAGVSITASHNPAPDNGLKLWTPSGQAYDADQREAITERITEERFDLAAWDGLGASRRVEDADATHRRALVEAVDQDLAAAADLSVAVDVGNGAGGVTADALEALGCHVETLNAQPDGRFPARPSEPTAENCASLRAHVAATDADLGIAHDGDADRMLAVDADGEWIPGDALLALFALREAGEGDEVATPVDTSLLVDDALASVGASVVHTKVGDVYVAERANAPGVAFGGEPSGAWIWPDETLCPDGPLAACKLVELVAGEGPLAAQVADLPRYPIRRANVEVEDKAARMERVAERVRERFDSVTTIDGVRAETDEGWLLVRASGTQPLIRVTAEARDEQRAEELAALGRDLIEAAG
ncbi:MAG: phosphoglucosamine mutase [Haloferacaceae archaeon]